MRTLRRDRSRGNFSPGSRGRFENEIRKTNEIVERGRESEFNGSRMRNLRRDSVQCRGWSIVVTILHFDAFQRMTTDISWIERFRWDRAVGFVENESGKVGRNLVDTRYENFSTVSKRQTMTGPFQDYPTVFRKSEERGYPDETRSRAYSKTNIEPSGKRESKGTVQNETTILSVCRLSVRKSKSFVSLIRDTESFKGKKNLSNIQRTFEDESSAYRGR